MADSGKWKVEGGEQEAGAVVAKVQRFEDLTVWQRARLLVGQVYAVTRQPIFRQHAFLVEQMRRAAVSVLSNIAEGFERRSRAEFGRFLMIAAGSAGELRAQAYVVEDCVSGAIEMAIALRRQTDEVSRLIGGLRKAVLRRLDATGR